MDLVRKALDIRFDQITNQAGKVLFSGHHPLKELIDHSIFHLISQLIALPTHFRQAIDLTFNQVAILEPDHHSSKIEAIAASFTDSKKLDQMDRVRELDLNTEVVVGLRDHQSWAAWASGEDKIQVKVP